MTRVWTLLGSAVVAAVVGLASLVTTVSRLVGHGIASDEQGTSGYASVGEVAGMGGGIFLLVAALGLGVLSLVMWMRSRTGRAANVPR